MTYFYWLMSGFDSNHPPQVMYCSSECRQAAADQYHRVLCLGPSQEDPDHPVNKLKDAWRWDILYGWGELLFIIKFWFTTASLQEYALPPRDLQHHADGQNGRCRQTGEALNWLEFSFDPVRTSAGVLTNVRADQTVAEELLLHLVYVTKAKDKDHWQKLFSRFCSRAANEEEEMAHKLLGEQFRVSLSSGHVCLSCVRVNVSAAPWANPGIAAPSGGVGIPSMPLSSFSSSSRGSWPCYTTFSKQHFMMTISVG